MHFARSRDFQQALCMRCKRRSFKGLRNEGERRYRVEIHAVGTLFLELDSACSVLPTDRYGALRIKCQWFRIPQVRDAPYRI